MNKETLKRSCHLFFMISFLVGISVSGIQSAFAFESQSLGDEGKGKVFLEGKSNFQLPSSPFLQFEYKKDEKIFTSDVEAKKYEELFAKYKNDDDVKKYIKNKTPPSFDPKDPPPGPMDRGGPNEEKMSEEKVTFMKGLIEILKKKDVKLALTSTSSESSISATNTVTCAKIETPSVLDKKTNEGLKDTEKVTEKLLSAEDLQKLKDQIRKEIEKEMKEKEPTSKITSSRSAPKVKPNDDESEQENGDSKPRMQNQQNSRQYSNSSMRMSNGGMAQQQGGVQLYGYSQNQMSGRFSSSNSSNSDQYQQQYQQLLMKYQQLQIQYEMMLQYQQNNSSMPSRSMGQTQRQGGRFNGNSYGGNGYGYVSNNFERPVGQFQNNQQSLNGRMNFGYEVSSPYTNYQNNSQYPWGMSSSNYYGSELSNSLKGYYQFSP